MSKEYEYQQETADEYDRLESSQHGTQAHSDVRLGINNYEPLIVILDSCIRYAKAHEYAYESKLAEDRYSVRYLKQVLSGVEGLLNCRGAVCLERDLKNDSKDGAFCEKLLNVAYEVAGIDERGY